MNTTDVKTATEITRHRSVKQEPEKTETSDKIVRRRRKERSFLQSGPLGWLNEKANAIPGYRLYLANEKQGKNPYRLQHLLSDDVCYEYVRPSEISLTDIHGSLIEDDKVKVDVGGGHMAYLLKLPIEYYEADMKARKERNEAYLKATADNNNGSLERGQVVMTTSSLTQSKLK